MRRGGHFAFGRTETCDAAPHAQVRPRETTGMGIGLLCSGLLGLTGLIAPGLASAEPDLMARIVMPSWGSVKYGQWNFIQLYVKNRGNTATPEGACVKVSFKGSTSPLLNVTGTYDMGFYDKVCSDDKDSNAVGKVCHFPSQSTGWCKVRRLLPGEELGFRISVYPAGTGGYSLSATADPDNRIRESNEVNTAVIALAVVLD